MESQSAVLSFPRKRESRVPSERRLDARFRGHDRLALTDVLTSQARAPVTAGAPGGKIQTPNAGARFKSRRMRLILYLIDFRSSFCRIR